MNWRALKYLTAYILPLTVAVSFTYSGAWVFLPLAYTFGFIPLAEWLMGIRFQKLNGLQLEVAQKDPLYDVLLYLMVPLQYGFLIWFGYSVSNLEPTSLTFWGRVSAYGLMCGVLGINVGHELGHRPKKWQQNLAKLLLSSSLYTHFFIEHNYGHHRNVATPQDPSSARLNEPLYFFWFRSVAGCYRNAWRLQRKMLLSAKASFWSLKNEMLWYQVFNLSLLFGVFLFFGFTALIGFLVAALTGILLLESVNYIEHYGLQRQLVSAKRYENTNVKHSWNSDHLIGRLVLFELSRHSDHHAHPHKKYQVLQSFAESPQMPTGYPGMILISLVPPVWFGLMNQRIKKLQLA
jgi:alkane 1-monooxygenase